MLLWLKGKTRKGKNRIREHGEWWSLFDNSLPGNTILVQSVAKKNELRWISLDNDPDFDVTVFNKG